MSLTVCIAAEDTLRYPEGGGRHWIFLNWLLGLRAIGCRVVWLEAVGPEVTRDELTRRFGALQERLEPYDVSEIALAGDPDSSVFEGLDGWMPSAEAAAEADLLVNFDDELNAVDVARFSRTAFVDRDPGLRQLRMHSGRLDIPPHDAYFSVGESVGSPSARFTDCGLRWHHVSPPVFVPAWKVSAAAADAPYTTVAHWWAGTERDGDGAEILNDKRAAFMPYADLPSRVEPSLELALNLDGNLVERSLWTSRGWSITEAWDVAATPWGYQEFIAGSRGEFSCAKPLYVHLQTGWVSDRTVCYLAAGKPVIVEDTGPSTFLPVDEGMFRFTDVSGAAAAIAAVEADYDRHSAAARALAEEYFDASSIATAVLERTLP